MAQETVLNHPEISSPPELPVGLRPDVQEEEGIDLIALATLLLREKKVILRFAAAAFVLTAIVAYGLMKPMYTA
jgi:uncharacterized protein involved in exopolysaccharide biosynthesis